MSASLDERRKRAFQTIQNVNICLINLRPLRGKTAGGQKQRGIAVSAVTIAGKLRRFITRAIRRLG